MSFTGAESLQVFKIKEFSRYIAARLFLTLGIQMQFGTIYLQVYYEYSKEEWTLGLIGLAEAIPFIITSLFSGHVADKFYKKRIIAFGIVFLLVGAVYLYLNAEPAVSLFRGLGISSLFFIVFIFGIVRSFLASAANPFITQLVPRKYYTQSATWNTTAWHTGAIAGPVIAGIVYGYNNQFNARWCHLTEAVLFLLALLFVLSIDNKGAPQTNGKKETVFDSMKIGLGFVFTNKMILSAISLDLFAVLFGGAVALIPAFTDKILHLGPEAYGLLRTAPAIGALAMAGVMILHPPAKKAGLALIWSVIAFGLFTILFALCTNYWLAFIMLFCTGAFDNVSVVVRHSILQLMTPDNMRGRVSAINSIFIGSSNEIGAFESGLAAKLLGLVPSIVFGGFMTIAVVLGVRKLNPKLQELDLHKLQNE